MSYILNLIEKSNKTYQLKANMRHTGFTFFVFFGNHKEAEKQLERIEQCFKNLI